MYISLRFDRLVYQQLLSHISPFLCMSLPRRKNIVLSIFLSSFCVSHTSLFNFYEKNLSFELCKFPCLFEEINTQIIAVCPSVFLTFCQANCQACVVIVVPGHRGKKQEYWEENHLPSLGTTDCLTC